MQNSGQGLGFLLGHAVIDRKTIVHAAVKLAGTVTTLYSVLLAFGQAPGVASPSKGIAECGVTAAQVAVIQATMIGHNESCSYDNVTLGSILGAT